MKTKKKTLNTIIRKFSELIVWDDWKIFCLSMPLLLSFACVFQSPFIPSHNKLANCNLTAGSLDICYAHAQIFQIHNCFHIKSCTDRTFAPRKMIYFDLLSKVILFKQNSCWPFWILFVSRWTKLIIKKSRKCHLSIFPVMHRKEVKKSFRGFETQSRLEVEQDRNSSYYAWYLTIVQLVTCIKLIHFVFESIFLKESRSKLFRLMNFHEQIFLK